MLMALQLSNIKWVSERESRRESSVKGHIPWSPRPTVGGARGGLRLSSERRIKYAATLATLGLHFNHASCRSVVHENEVVYAFPRKPLLCTTFVLGQRTASTSHLHLRHFLKKRKDVRVVSASAQRATATADSRAEVKLDPCAQLSEAGS